MPPWEERPALAAAAIGTVYLVVQLCCLGAYGATWDEPRRDDLLHDRRSRPAGEPSRQASGAVGIQLGQTLVLFTTLALLFAASDGPAASRA